MNLPADSEFPFRVVFFAMVTAALAFFVRDCHPRPAGTSRIAWPPASINSP